MQYRALILGRLGAIIIPAIILIVSVLASIAIERALVQTQRSTEESMATRKALAVANVLRGKIAFHKMLSETIAHAVAINPSLDQQTFSELVEPFLETNPGLVNIAVAQDLLVKFVHPFEPNKSVVGLDYETIPQQLASITQMRERGETVFTGPVELVQGGRGYIHRSPIITKNAKGEEKFWGLVSVVSSETELLNFAIEPTATGLDFATTSVSQVSGQRELLWGSEAVWSEDTIYERVSVGDQVWEVAVGPANGWTTVSDWRNALIALNMLLAGGLAALVFGVRIIIKSKLSSWEKLSDAIEVIDDGFALYDADDRLVMCNSKYKSYYMASSHLMTQGATFEEIIRGGVENGQYLEAIGREDEWIAERLAKHRNPGRPIEQLLDDGRWLKVLEAKMSDGSTVGFRVDVTELKHALQIAQTANAAKTAFLNTVSHEIRTPLSAIIGYCSVLKKIDTMPEHRSLKEKLIEHSGSDQATEDCLRVFDNLIHQYALRIEANSSHLSHIIDDILYWSSAEQGQKDISHSVVDLSEITELVVDQLHGLSDEKGLRLTVETAEASVLGDSVRLKQVLLNLIGNALKFTETGYVHVSVERSADEVVLMVEDTGCGMPQSSLGEIFEPFRQLDSGMTRRYGGCGLGLAITRDIVEAHGGSISVSSEVGAGSIFTVNLTSAEQSNVAPPRREILENIHANEARA